MINNSNILIGFIGNQLSSIKYPVIAIPYRYLSTQASSYKIPESVVRYKLEGRFVSPVAPRAEKITLNPFNIGINEKALIGKYINQNFNPNINYELTPAGIVFNDEISPKEEENLILFIDKTINKRF